jgi:hypothetical protein
MSLLVQTCSDTFRRDYTRENIKLFDRDRIVPQHIASRFECVWPRRPLLAKAIVCNFRVTSRSRWVRSSRTPCYTKQYFETQIPSEGKQMLMNAEERTRTNSLHGGVESLPNSRSFVFIRVRSCSFAFATVMYTHLNNQSYE